MEEVIRKRGTSLSERRPETIVITDKDNLKNKTNVT